MFPASNMTASIPAIETVLQITYIENKKLGKNAMQTENKFFNDLARLAGGASSTFANLRIEVESLIKQRLERLLADMDLVPRDEFEAVKMMASKARAEQEVLQNKIVSLEASLKKLNSKKIKKTSKNLSKK